MTIYYSVFKTNFGWCGLIGSKKGLLEFILPKSGRSALYACLRLKYQTARPNDQLFDHLMQELKNYFQGEEISINFPLDKRKYTSFQRKVWMATRKIPYGETNTYGWISRQINNISACRAVGQALSRNPFPILVPCHRVIKSNGELGGFSGGIVLKKRLLRLEEVKQLKR